MSKQVIYSGGSSVSFLKIWKKKVLKWLRLTDNPVIKIYHGYGNAGQMAVFGHVFALSPLPRTKYHRNIWTNTFALIRLFMVRTIPGIAVELHYGGEVVNNITEADGFFRFQWTPASMPSPGWHTVAIKLSGEKFSFQNICSEGKVYIPYTHRYGVISDIDDTFLISHSSNLRKRLYVLLTKNAHSRKPFEGVVKHYQALTLAGASATEPNPFFYVSSSEWNLYDYIIDFTRKNELPMGVYLLSQIKHLSEAWKTGQNKHATKFMRISRILEAFPDRQFILLGDDSQQDPGIYASVVEHFPGKIKAVYLRNVFIKNEAALKESISAIQAAGVACCHFQHSREALEHSAAMGLI